MALHRPPATQYTPTCMLDSTVSLNIHSVLWLHVIVQELSPVFGARYQPEIIKNGMYTAFSLTKQLGNLNTKDLYCVTWYEIQKNHFGALKYYSSIYVYATTWTPRPDWVTMIKGSHSTVYSTNQKRLLTTVCRTRQDKIRHQRLTVSGIKLSEWVGEWFYCSQDATIRTYTHTKIPFVWPLYLDREKAATSFLPSILACLNPSAKRSTSAISSLSGLDMATGRNSCFRLSGSFCRPP